MPPASTWGAAVAAAAAAPPQQPAGAVPARCRRAIMSAACSSSSSVREALRGMGGLSRSASRRLRLQPASCWPGRPASIERRAPGAAPAAATAPLRERLTLAEGGGGAAGAAYWMWEGRPTGWQAGTRAAPMQSPKLPAPSAPEAHERAVAVAAHALWRARLHAVGKEGRGAGRRHRGAAAGAFVGPRTGASVVVGAAACAVVGRCAPRGLAVDGGWRRWGGPAQRRAPRQLVGRRGKGVEAGGGARARGRAVLQARGAGDGRRPGQRCLRRAPAADVDRQLQRRAGGRQAASLCCLLMLLEEQPCCRGGQLGGSIRS